MDKGVQRIHTLHHKLLVSDKEGEEPSKTAEDRWSLSLNKTLIVFSAGSARLQTCLH